MHSGAVPNISVMSAQEEYIMEKSADIICKNGGHILNIGYGLGIIDKYIAKHNISSHTIIEAHVDVYHEGLKTKPKNANMICARWEDAIYDLMANKMQFDGIYFDTINTEGHYNQWSAFARVVGLLLKPGGIFSYFNHTAVANEQYFESIMRSYGWQQCWLKLDYKDIEKHSPVKMDENSLNVKDYLLTWFIKI